ncbi:MAG: T9SS type B sorting domain-containing protein, partial [Chitinophagaceae bacterium]
TGWIFTYWNDAATTSPLTNSVAVNTSGNYYIQATATGGCNLVQVVEVNVIVNEGKSSMRYSTVVTNANASVQLNARNFGNNNSYIWNPPVALNSYSIQNPVFNRDRNTEYTIKINFADNCEVVDTVQVLVLQNIPNGCESDLFVPKAWSPNSDGHNDKLFPITICIKELKYFRIFNRWGQLMFETNIIGQGWDGMFHGQPQVMDTYTWTVEATGEDGRYFKRAGNSVLLR